MTDPRTKYRIYQDDDAPDGWGVQAIVYEHPEVGWAMVTGGKWPATGDYYINRDGVWMAVDFAGLLDFVVNELGVAMVGRTISNAEYQRIYRRAKADMNQAQKTGWLPNERRPE